MSYLIDKEKEDNDMALLQICTGLQSCNTKGDVVELLKEAQQLEVEKYKQRVKQAILKINLNKGEVGVIAEYMNKNNIKRDDITMIDVTNAIQEYLLKELMLGDGGIDGSE